jgi:penicillin-binding protein 1A
MFLNPFIFHFYVFYYFKTICYNNFSWEKNSEYQIGGNMKEKKKKKKSRILKVFKIFFITLFSLAVLGGVAAGGITLAIIKTAPKLDLNLILTLNEPSKLYYKNKENVDEFMDEAPTEEKREIVSYKDIPKNLSDAFVSIEDERFWTHNGIDLRRIAGAALIDVQKIIKKESGMHGASTIPQQLLKNTLLSDEFSFKRKIQEAYLATELVKSLPKEEILVAYMNTIGLGGNINGVQKAAQIYFNKNVQDLDLIQCAFIAGVTQNPSKYYPYSQRNKDNKSALIDRTKTVLYTMNSNGYIDEATYKNAINELDTKQIAFEPLKSSKVVNKLQYEWFSRPAMDAVKKDLMAQYHYSAEEVNNLVSLGGLTIYTTMDKDLQLASENIFNDQKNFKKSEVDGKNILQPQASAVVMDYRTGQVKAIVGGRGEQPAASKNRAANSSFTKPTGSSLKPLAIYAPAIDTKQATAATVLEDSPISSEISNKFQGWDPRNYNTNSFQGYVTLREALRKSTNLFAIKLEYAISIKTGASYAEKFGIPITPEEKGDGTSKKPGSLAALSLGEISGTNTLTMAAAYGVFGNNGMYTEPILYTKVVDRTGKIILQKNPATRKVLSPQSAYVMYDLLKEPTSGLPGSTAGSAKFGNMPAAGKTGTTSNNTDFWFTGLTPYYSGAVWIGNDVPKKDLNKLGYSSSTSATLWSKLMAEAHKNLEVKDIPQPTGIKTALVCKDSGKIATDLCARDPRGNRVYEEIFIDGTLPTTLCDTHVEAKINKTNGKLATEFTPLELIESKVFIKRDYTPSVHLDDQGSVLPSFEQDDYKPQPTPTPTISPSPTPTPKATPTPTITPKPTPVPTVSPSLNQ